MGYPSFYFWWRARAKAKARVADSHLEEVLHLPLRTCEARHDLIAAIVQRAPLSPDFVLEEVASRTDGYSIARLYEVCELAGELALRKGESARAANADAVLREDYTLSLEHFERAIDLLARKRAGENLSGASW